MSFNVSHVASFLKSDLARFSLKLGIAVLVSVVTVGCSGNQGAAPTAPAPEVSTEPAGSDSVETSASGTQIALSPDNTLIQFVGTHVGADPDPKARTGKFTEFAGTAVVTDDELSSLSLEIQMSSARTGNEKLDAHLQNEDFFSVREHPTATFESLRIARNEDGQHLVTGNLTLHSATNEITFPANVGMVDGKLSLSGTMTLDRTEFGMTKMTDKVNANVEMTFKIGDVTAG